MLFELINANRDAIVGRVCERASIRDVVSEAANAELTECVATIVSQLSDVLFLRYADPATSAFERREEMTRAGAAHGEALLRHGFTLAQVVDEYTEIGHAIIDLATERRVTLSHEDFLNVYLSVNAAVAGAVSEHSRLRGEPASSETKRAWATAAAGNITRSQSR